MKIDLKFHITKKLQNLLDVLKSNNGEPRFVGGMVRDQILGLDIRDIDIASKLFPEEMMIILSQNHIKWVDTGSKFGTITAILGDEKAEITTLRIDTECDGRHAKTIFTDDFEQDAKRRDFTINAMSYCPFSKELYDYTGGYEDLQAKKVRFIGDPERRIEEDYLRILRFFRFSDRFADNVDADSLKACLKYRHCLNKLSQERIIAEFDKMILSKTADEVFTEMQKSKIIEEIMHSIKLDTMLLGKLIEITSNCKELAEEAIYFYNYGSHSLARDEGFLAEFDISLRYAALFHDNDHIVLKKTLEGMRFSNNRIKQVIELVLFRQKYSDLSSGNLSKFKEIFYPLWIHNTYLRSIYFYLVC
ncbi:MAG UNVERIFIED_CONTAM: CCA tRNA nucleotidyltransferase [Rickettsiaceae bacterium]|jgi:tRNA nucleotidyltransferase/poly(A) polymerase